VLIPLQTVPYVRLAKRLLRGRGDLHAVASSEEVLCPEETTPNRAAIFLPGQLERITDTPSETTKEMEIAAATRPTSTHSASIAYHIKDAVLVDGSVYIGHHRHYIADKMLFPHAAGEPEHLGSAALASSYYGTKYFSHWLVDDCTRYQLANAGAPPLCLRTPYAHRRQYQNYFDQDWTPTDRARIDHLVIFRDFDQNSLKKKRYEALRHRVSTHFPRAGRASFVYLRRGRSGAARLVENEAEIIDALVKRGFVVVDVVSDSLEHILATLVDARVVVSMEGSHLGHCAVALPANSGIIALQPPDRFSAHARGWCECIGIRFGFVVGAKGETGSHFSCSDILRTTDLMMRSIANTRVDTTWVDTRTREPMVLAS
jgi:hypothetical protein